MQIATKFVFETATWRDHPPGYYDRKTREEPRTLTLSIDKSNPRGDIIKFNGGPTGFESYYIKDLLSGRRKGGDELCICGGTVNSWPSCRIDWATIEAFLQDEGYEKQVQS